MSLLTLENTLIDDQKLAESPSFKDGIEIEMEIKLRFLGANMIESAGIILGLPQAAMATACVLFHRFFYMESFKKHDLLTISIGAVFLSCKIEESNRKMRDIANAFHFLQSDKSKQYIPMDYNGIEYLKMKDLMIEGELLILTSLGFNVRVQHPYGYLVNYLQALQLDQDLDFCQRAWNYLNDSLRTNVCVCYQPSVIACAAIHLASIELTVPLPNEPEWYKVFDSNEQDLNDISNKLRSLYSIRIK